MTGVGHVGCEHCDAYTELYSLARDVVSSTNGGLLPPTLGSLERLQRFFSSHPYGESE